MAKSSNDERDAALQEFGKYLEDQLTEKRYRQADLVRVSGLDKRVVSQMIAGVSERLTLKNYFPWLRGLILLDVLTEQHEVTYWLRQFCYAKGVEFRSLEDLDPQGEELFTLIKQMKADREKVVEQPKYKYVTAQGIPVIGRDQDIPMVLDKLLGQGIQFYTLVGPPGVGKTEIARQVAIVIERESKAQFSYINTLYFEHERHAEEAVKRISSELRHLSIHSRMLLILDNCEQLDGLTEELNTLIKRHPTLSILATSRVMMSPNNLQVEPLDLPQAIDEDLETLGNYAAIQLFLKRANMNKPDTLELTAENAYYIVSICIGLDGLPLALLMAGSWLDRGRFTIKGLWDSLLSLKVQEEKYRFSGKVFWHITLDALIQWSYELLDPQAQQFFRRLTVIPRAYNDFWFNPSTAAIICPMKDLPENLVQIWDALIRHGFISWVDQRMCITHNTIHDFGRRTLDKPEVKEGERMRESFLLGAYEMEYHCFTTEIFNRRELEVYADGRGFFTRRFWGHSLILLTSPNTGKCEFKFWVPEWATALHSLLEEYIQHRPWRRTLWMRTGCIGDIFTAWRNLLESKQIPTKVLDSRTLLVLLQEEFNEVCKKRLRAEVDKEIKSLSTLAMGIWYQNNEWAEWDHRYSQRFERYFWCLGRGRGFDWNIDDMSTAPHPATGYRTEYCPPPFSDF